MNLPDDFGVRQVIGTTHTRIDPATNTVLETLDDRSYTWDRVFNKTRRADVRAASTGQRLRHEYGYDRAYRMVHATVTDTAAAVGSGSDDVRRTGYALDGVHNRLNTAGTIGLQVAPATGTYTMNAVACNNLGNPLIPAVGADRELNQYTTTPLDVRTYDHNGNLTSVLGNDAAGNALAVSCLYDYRNRMVEYRDNTVNGQRHTYAYDVLGRRIAKTTNADGVNGASPTTTRYFYGGQSQWQVCEEQIPDCEIGGIWRTSATYVYGRYIDEVLQMQRCPAGNTCGSTQQPPACAPGAQPVDYYYHTDDLYNVMAVTDSSGNVVERYEYDDYGTPLFMAPGGAAHTSSSIANPYLFTGRRFDPESGWYNYRTRYLGPVTGRFTGRDVIGIWGDPMEFGNGYTYVANSPLSWNDPFGEGKGRHHSPKPSNLPSNWGQLTRSQKIAWLHNAMKTASNKGMEVLRGILKLVKRGGLALGPVGAFFCLGASECHAPMLPLDYLDPRWLQYMHRICWKIEKDCKSNCNSLYPPGNDSSCFFGDSPNEESREDCKSNCSKKRSKCDKFFDDIYAMFL